MRILFTNLVKTATLSTDSPNASYSVDNLAHATLRKRYQSTVSPATITVTFAADSDVNCFFYGYHNCTTITLRLYDSGDTLLKTVSIASPESGVGSEFFTTVSSVAYAEIDITAGPPVYLGGIGLGVYYDVGRPNADFEEGSIDNSVKVSSPAGQLQQLRVEPIGSNNYQVSGMLRETRNALVAQIDAVGEGAPLWIDAFYGDHSYAAPFYGTIYNRTPTRKAGKYFSMSFELREMR